MIFVSYNRDDEEWRKRFEIVSKPLSRAEGMKFWSDRNVKAGEWEPQIEKAMQGAVAVVLLVSDNFLASDYIIEKELPFFLRAYRERGLMIFWAYLEPCDLTRHPEITAFKSMTHSLEPMSKMSKPEWKQALVDGCRMIDEYLKELERPIINPAIQGGSFPKIAENVPLLAEPARRRVEVLVHADKKWWKQWGIQEGKTTTKIQLGNDQTKPGTKFKVVAITSENALDKPTYPNLPDHRTRSEELTLIRA